MVWMAWRQLAQGRPDTRWSLAAGRAAGVGVGAALAVATLTELSEVVSQTSSIAFARDAPSFAGPGTRGLAYSAPRSEPEPCRERTRRGTVS